MMFDDISGSFPAIAGGLSDADARALYESLPLDYRQFLDAHNGGFVEEGRYTFLTGVPFKFSTVDNPSRDDCPVEFFGFATTDASGEWPSDILQKLADHRAEEFLPRGVVAIARCVQSSLVCISLRDDDRGTIYYWDWYWRYPWCKEFFDGRISEATARFANPRAILEDRDRPQFLEVFDALNFATIVKLSASFSEWSRGCQDRREPR
jgi:SMI1-KNR4 cell-wall